MSHVVSCINLEGDCALCGRSAGLFDRIVTEDTRESGLLIVSLRRGCIQIAMVYRRGEGGRRKGIMGLKWQPYSDTMSIYNQSE